MPSEKTLSRIICIQTGKLILLVTQRKKLESGQYSGEELELSTPELKYVSETLKKLLKKYKGRSAHN